MARKKIPSDETAEQTLQRKQFETIANASDRSAKTSWNRKMDNLVKLTTNIKPVEEKILHILLEEKQPLMDDIDKLRKGMVKECIHPYEYLVMQDSHILCKFCNSKISIPKQ